MRRALREGSTLLLATMTLILLLLLLDSTKAASKDSDSPQRRTRRDWDSRLHAPKEDGDALSSPADETTTVKWRLDTMEDMSLTSDDKANFRCRVVASGGVDVPMQNFTFQWYKDNVMINKHDDSRIVIKRKPWGSQMRIMGIYSSDSGLYRCEASDGKRRVDTQALLEVSWHSIPEGGRDPEDVPKYQGSCEVYQGTLCSYYFADKYVYVDHFSSQAEMEQNVKDAQSSINNAKLSRKCLDMALKTFCFFLFSTCDPTLTPAVEKPLCREDCELFKYDICHVEFTNARRSGDMLQQAFKQNDCSLLPKTRTATSTDHCSQLGIPRAVIGTHRCYNDTGADYKGTLSIGATGESCVEWPKDMVTEHPSLAGGHNFCRNPGGEREAPWCYVDMDSMRQETCQVPKCDGGNSDLVMILIPAVSVPLLLGCLLLVFCSVCRKSANRGASHGSNSKGQAATGAAIADAAPGSKGVPLIAKEPQQQVNKHQTNVPELMPNNLRVLQELGEGRLGKVFKAQMLGNFSYYSHEPVTVKTLTIGADLELEREFHKEIEMFSHLQHVNVASLKAVVMQPTLRCMVFEYTGNVDLHEYLVMHSPQADFAKPVVIGSSNMSQASSSLDPNDCLRMMVQIAAGMEYLASKNFVHRDLAARNVLVCSNMEMKISNLGLIQDSYLSCYYRSPQGGQMLPIRWMAPESLQNWQFSDKSAVWSYGVLLWEMFSYGMQPYCGYSNHEVLDMIGRRQLLDCPDQCPAKVYSLMIECWCEQSIHRPSFKDVHAKLNGWDPSGVTRMTSQLAHGIHRQLDQMKRSDDPLMMKMNSSTPLPPHQHQLGMIDERYAPDKGFYPSSTTQLPPAIGQNNGHVIYQDGPPSSSASHLIVDGNTSSSGVGGNVYVNLPNSRDASTASYHTRPPPYGPGQQSFLLSGRTSQQHQQQPPSQGSVYSRSDGSVQSSLIGANGKLQSEESSLKTLKQQPYHVSGSNGVTSLATQRKLSNGYGSPAATNGYETPVSPGLSHNHRTLHTHRFQPDHHHHQQDYPTIDRSFHDERLLKRDDSSVRTTSAQPPPPSSSQQQPAQEAKTPSCDSGLPNEETEFGSDGADSARPLLNHQQQQRAMPVTQQQQQVISPVASM